MKTKIIDFSLRAPQYTIPLLESLSCADEHLLFVTPVHCNLLRRLNKSRFRKIYLPFYVIFWLLLEPFRKAHKIHFIWTPLNKILLDTMFLSFLKYFKKEIILTIHNIEPHGSNYSQKAIQRFYNLVDVLIFHDEAALEIFQNKVLTTAQCKLIPHGMDFGNLDDEPKQKLRGNLSLLIFGHMKAYKGVIEFLIELDAANLPFKVNINLVGLQSDTFARDFQKLKLKNPNITVSAINKYVNNLEMNRRIAEADLLLYPYLKITTSGALLKGLELGKVCVTTKLPYFYNLERKYGVLFTYRNLDEFFQIVLSYIHDPENIQKSVKKRILAMENIFSWKVIGKSHLMIYLND